MKKLIVFLQFLLWIFTTNSQIQLPKVITDNMVMQQGKKVAIWGTASEGEKISVTFAGQKLQATADESGKWQVYLKPMKASAEPKNMIISGKNTIVLKNILVGEVWLCSGQSNMEYPLDRSLKRYAGPKKGEDIAAKVLAEPRNPLIRHLYVERKHQDILPTSGWKDGNDSTLKYVSAAGYFFAKELAEKLNIPVGIISSSWGGTRVEQWTPPEAYLTSHLFKDTIAGKEKFKIDGMEPGKMFQSMLKPIIPYTMKGILWYQGESNVMIHDTNSFIAKTKLMLDTWKMLWNDKNLSFYYVQLAPYYYSKRKDKLTHEIDLLPRYWELQTRMLNFPKSGMAVVTDLVDNMSDIHPGYKWEVGRRLALWALAKDYKQKFVYSGPLYKSMKIKNNTIEITFNHTANSLISLDGEPLTWFTIAGSDKKFFPALAVIKGNKILVSSPEVSQPKAVRFAWNESAMPNLGNSEKLPASPFRTDNW